MKFATTLAVLSLIADSTAFVPSSPGLTKDVKRESKMKKIVSLFMADNDEVGAACGFRQRLVKAFLTLVAFAVWLVSANICHDRRCRCQQCG